MHDLLPGVSAHSETVDLTTAKAPAGGKQRLPRLAAIPLLTTALAGGVTFALPARYRAQCVLQYQRERADRAADAVEDAVLGEEWYRTQDVLLTSDSVLTRVLREMSTEAENASRRAGRAVACEAEPVTPARLRAKLDVDRIEGTRLVRLTAEDSDPTHAARLADAVAKHYLAWSFEQRAKASEDVLERLSRQVGAANERLAHTDGELQAYVERHRETALPVGERQSLLAEEIKQLTRSLAALRQREMELAARLTKLKSARRDDPFESHTNEIDANPDVRTLRASYLDASLSYREALLAEGDAGVAAGLARSRMEELRSELQKVIDGILHAANGELTETQAVTAQFEIQLERATGEAWDLQKQQLEVGRLEREREAATRVWRTLYDGATTAEIAVSTSAAAAAIVEPATRPTDASRPWARNLAVGAGLGLLALAAIARSWRKG